MSRRRATGIAGQFAMLPSEVLTSDAWRTATHAARSTLTVIADQYRGHSNGLMALTPTICSQYGIDRHVAAASAAQLCERGLIVRTGDGGLPPWPPVTYALAWRPITHLARRLLDRPQPAPNKWATWTPSAPDGLDLIAWERYAEYRAERQRPIRATSVLSLQQQLARLGSHQLPAIVAIIEHGEIEIRRAWRLLGIANARRRASA